MYGSRYVEYLARLGVRSSDGRLSRPEYLGGGRQTLQFSEVLQTAADGSNPVSTLRGHGVSALRSNSFTRFMEEHGYIFTLMYVKPKTIYMSGMSKTWNRRTKFDFWQKELEYMASSRYLIRRFVRFTRRLMVFLVIRIVMRNTGGRGRVCLVSLLLRR